MPDLCAGPCPRCGRFLRWVSLQSPAERHAKRVKASLMAMQQYPPSPKQLALLLSLKHTGTPPASMAEASTLIDELRATPHSPQKGGAL